ncbi:MAG TPA: hypothetical protein P5528_13500 [Steroidobacteraceae bacterium]|nr:hypothetical protein [Steroidobacteraceae bacterium]HRX90451.1 hypothetical protein [Steroidobacteraceae bacterium]
MPFLAQTIIWLLLATVGSQPSRAADASSIIAGLARPLPAATTFRELRFSTMLKEPLMVRGSLEIDADGNMIRRVTDPFTETTKISGDRVAIERDGKTRQFSLRRAPELEGLLAAFRALINGAADELGQRFVVRLQSVDAAHEPSAAAFWRLQLTPRDSRLARRVVSIDVTGTAAEPRCLTLLEPQKAASVLLLGAAASLSLPMPASREALAALCSQG